MDRAFLSYYEAELAHVRDLSKEFAALHPTVARNLSLDSVPCPDPYVERLLEGVAYLAARTRLKLDGESQRHVRGVLDALYPDLAAPAPAMSTVVLHPGPQVQTMADGHLVKRGTRLVAALRDGISTRAVYTTAQDVTLWPVVVDAVEYLQDRGALSAAGVPDALIKGAEAGLKLTFRRQGPGALADLSLDRLDVEFSGGPRSAAIFDAVFASPLPVIARRAAQAAPFFKSAQPELIGIRDDEALLPRLRSSFEGYRLLREYFLMPERFYGVRLSGLSAAVKSSAQKMEVVLPMGRTASAIADVSRPRTSGFSQLRSLTCSRKSATSSRWTPVPRHMSCMPTAPGRWISRSTACSGCRTPKPTVRSPICSHFTHQPRNRGRGLVYTTERRPRRPGGDELRRGSDADQLHRRRSLHLGRAASGRAADAADPAAWTSVRLVSNRDLADLR